MSNLGTLRWLVKPNNHHRLTNIRTDDAGAEFCCFPTHYWLDTPTMLRNEQRNLAQAMMKRGSIMNGEGDRANNNPQDDLFGLSKAAADRDSNAHSAAADTESNSVAVADTVSNGQVGKGRRINDSRYGVEATRKRIAYRMSDYVMYRIVNIEAARPWEAEGIGKSTWYVRHPKHIERQTIALRALVADKRFDEIERVRKRVCELQIIRCQYAEFPCQMLGEFLTKLSEVLESVPPQESGE